MRKINIKKTIPLMLLCALVLPLALLFGCGDSNSYSVTALTSSTNYGSVSGTGSYTEGTTITLTATAKNGSHFLAWVKEGKILIDDTNKTYSITNTTSSSTEEETISKSVLSFSSSSNTSGSYTAVFAESKVMYAQLKSVYFCTSLSSTPSSASDGTSIFQINSIVLSEGSSNLETIISGESIAVSNAVYVLESEVSSNNSVIKLSATTAQYVGANLVLVSTENSAKTLSMRAALTFQSSTQQQSYSTYTSEVTYADGTYSVVFTFDLSNVTYYMVLTYQTLS